ncbi:MAG: hypothetical protein J1E84_05045 [Muribaculaceae bacterium]|nr:hypothetical protein [Muribaculaceae bacterium]
MKKFYTLLLAIVLTLPAFAQTTLKDLEGDWTFTVYDNSEGTSTTPVKLQLTCEVDGYEAYFMFPDDVTKFFYIGGSASNGDGTLGLRFDSWDQGKKGDYYPVVQPYYISSLGEGEQTVWADYNAETESFVKFYRKNSSLILNADNIGFRCKLYNSILHSGDVAGTWDYTIISAEKTKELGTLEIDQMDVFSYDNGGGKCQMGITANVIANGIEESYDVHYKVETEDGTEPVAEGKSTVEIPEGTEGEFTYSVSFYADVDFGTAYTVTVWAESGEVKSDEAVKEYTTVKAPAKLEFVKAEAQNVTETTADIYVEFIATGLEDQDITVLASTSNGPTVENVVVKNQTSATLKVEGLEAGKIYTYNVDLRATNPDNGNTIMPMGKPVVIETPESPYKIELSSISYKQVANGAAFTVGSVEATGFEDDAVIDVYFQLNGSEEAPQKAIATEDGKYEFTFSNLKPLTPYTAIIFGGSGEYGSDDFIKGEVYPENFVAGEPQPSAIVRTATASNVTTNSADIEVTYIVENVPDGGKAYIIATQTGVAEDATPIVEKIEVEAGENKEAVINLTNLTAETAYTFEVTAVIYNSHDDQVSEDAVTPEKVAFTTEAEEDKSGIQSIDADGNAAVRFFNLQGVEISNPAAGGVYIKVDGNKVDKVLVK